MRGYLWSPDQLSLVFVCFLQIPVALFFQELLIYQGDFAKHYADGLDGCGLQHEAKVRQAFYQMIRRMSEPFHELHKHQLDK